MRPKPKQNTRHYRQVINMAFLCLGILLGFQNCGAPAPELEESTDASSTDTSTEPTDEIFAYDMSVDHVSYMSCSNMSGSPLRRAFYTFKVGAYENEGFKLTNDFIAQFEKDFSSSYIDELESIRTSIANSQNNAATEAQLSLRSELNLQAVRKPSGVTTARLNLEYATFFDNGQGVGRLDRSLVVGSVYDLPRSQRLNFLSNVAGVSDTRRVEASVHFNTATSNVTSEQVRSLVNEIVPDNSGPAFLGITYSNYEGTYKTNALAPIAGSKEAVYGRGFKFEFTAGHGISRNVSSTLPEYSIAHQRVLNDVYEYDLLDPTSGGNSSAWVCPKDHRFVIVDQIDLFEGENTGADTVCNTSADPLDPDTFWASTPSKARAFKRLRQFLRAEDWYIDMDRQCVVSKHNSVSCYGDRSAGQTVNYRSNDTDTVNCGRNGDDLCPHYVSVCYKL